MRTSAYMMISADDCDMILRARQELAARYGWKGRAIDCYEALAAGTRVVEFTLAAWDDYNAHVEALSVSRIKVAS